jgi:toxin YoeB
MFTVELSRQAQKDLQKLKQTGLTNAAKELVDILKNNPFQTQPPFEKLVGNLSGKYSRRLNIKHRLVYMVTGNTVIILSMTSSLIRE